MLLTGELLTLSVNWIYTLYIIWPVGGVRAIVPITFLPFSQSGVGMAELLCAAAVAPTVAVAEGREASRAAVPGGGAPSGVPQGSPWVSPGCHCRSPWVHAQTGQVRRSCTHAFSMFKKKKKKIVAPRTVNGSGGWLKKKFSTASQAELTW